MKKILTAAALTICFAGVAKADICGIVKTGAGRTASNIIDAQVAQNPNGYATLIDSGSNTSMRVKDARVSNRNGADLGDGKYFSLIVTKVNGEEQEIDAGYTYVVLADGDTAVSLNVLTNCGAGVRSSHPFIRLSSLGGK